MNLRDIEKLSRETKRINRGLNKLFRNKKNSTVLGLAALSLATLLTFDLPKNFNIKNIFNSHSTKANIQLDGSLEDLVKTIEVVNEPLTTEKYDRDEWTSASQSYEFKGEKYSSIRKYSYYASKNMNDQGYVDPYTNEYLELNGGDYDHIIPLAYAHLYGGYKWSDVEKKAFADDPRVGVVVNSSDNKSKGAKGPSEWLPKANLEDYAFTWLVIASEYDLSINKEDMDTIMKLLDGVSIEDVKVINQYN